MLAIGDECGGAWGLGGEGEDPYPIYRTNLLQKMYWMV